MAGVPKNRLTIVPQANGKFLLTGYVFGKQVRRVHANVSVLEALRARLEAPARAQELARRGEEGTRLSTLTEAEEKAAKAIFQVLGGTQDAMRVVLAGIRAVRTEERQFPVNRALVLWKRRLTQLHRSGVTVDKNIATVRRMLRALPDARYLPQLTAKRIEQYVLREGVAIGTQVSEGATIRAWLNFCQKERLIAASPFTLDLADLKQTDRTHERPRILTPEQAQRLLKAALTAYDGAFAAYTLLSLFCFMRHAEVIATAPEDILADRVRVVPKKRGTVSYRTVTIPENVRQLLADAIKRHGRVIYSAQRWDVVREKAGLLKLAKRLKRGGNRRHLKSAWQANILRHTGISYLYQQTGSIAEVCRQAGNSSDVSFRHYLDLPPAGACQKFYAISAVLPAPQSG